MALLPYGALASCTTAKTTSRQRSQDPSPSCSASHKFLWQAPCSVSAASAPGDLRALLNQHTEAGKDFGKSALHAPLTLPTPKGSFLCQAS